MYKYPVIVNNKGYNYAALSWHHALRVNHNPGQALVYQCGLKPGAIIADYSKHLTEQPAVYDRLIAGLPVIISSNLSTGRDWHLLNSPYYGNHKGRVWYQGIRGKADATIINLFRKCGIHGVHDWELHNTDAHYQGPTIVIFDTEVLEIQDIVEVNYGGLITWAAVRKITGY